MVSQPIIFIPNYPRPWDKGFTLIEMAMVLTIIGLIAAGILIGKDLILAARIRQQLTQLEQYTTAIHTFRSKYNGLPGDLTNASNLGFIARSGIDGEGDGDGVIERCEPWELFGISEYLGCENTLFWTDLSAANLIPERFVDATNGKLINIPQADIKKYFPTPKLPGRGYIIIATEEEHQKNWYVLVLIDGDIDSDGLFPTNTILYPMEAYIIDTKIDDGRPDSGKVMPKTVAYVPFGFFFSDENVASYACRNTASTYNVTYTQWPNCRLLNIAIGIN